MKHIFLILFLTLCFIFSFQSEKISAENRVNFQHISLKEGLSQNTVYDIKQDQLGYIWVATADGLNRYDGYKFVVFRHNPKDSLSLPSNTTNSLLLDKKGDLWIGNGDEIHELVEAFLPGLNDVVWQNRGRWISKGLHLWHSIQEDDET